MVQHLLVCFDSLVMNFLTIAGLLYGALASLTSPMSAGRIFGGRNATIEEYPHQVSVEHSGIHKCGGVILSRSLVLTAAHCTLVPAEQIGVRAGSSYRQRGGSVHSVLHLLRHPGYHQNEFGNPMFDVALLSLGQPIELDATRAAARLFGPGEPCPPGSPAEVTGWGLTQRGYPDQLQSVGLPVIDAELCADAYDQLGGVGEEQLCAAEFGQGGKDACVGDSGGPMLVEGRLAAIVSWGESCAEPFYPGVYSRIGYFRDWIDQNAEL